MAPPTPRRNAKRATTAANTSSSASAPPDANIIAQLEARIRALEQAVAGNTTNASSAPSTSSSSAASSTASAAKQQTQQQPQQPPIVVHHLSSSPSANGSPTPPPPRSSAARSAAKRRLPATKQQHVTAKKHGAGIRRHPLPSASTESPSATSSSSKSPSPTQRQSTSTCNIANNNENVKKARKTIQKKQHPFLRRQTSPRKGGGRGRPTAAAAGSKPAVAAKKPAAGQKPAASRKPAAGQKPVFDHTAPSKVLVHGMPEHMIKEALRLAVKGMQECTTEDDVATLVRQAFDTKYGKFWNCVMGKYGASLQFNKNRYVDFEIGDICFVVFQTD